MSPLTALSSDKSSPNPACLDHAQPISIKYTRFRGVQSIILSAGQILVGLACIGLNAALLGVIKNKLYKGSLYAVVSHGIWGGFFFVVAGILGIRAGKTKSGCSVIAFMVLSLVSALATAVIFALSMHGCLSSRTSDTLGLNITLVVLSFIEGVLAIWASVLCCLAVGSYPTLTYGSVGQTTSAGQQVYVVNSP